jgi:uncharacterized tellurite resistance protein B-like protein
MDNLSILIAVAGIVVTGALSKVGENVADRSLSKAKQLLSYIENKLPHTATAIKNVDQQSIDYDQISLQIEAITKSDPEMQKLLQEMKEIVLTDEKVAQAVEHELVSHRSKLATGIENWKGINVKGGTNSITGNIFL